MELIFFLLIGLLAGLAANAIMGRRSSFILNVILGVAGAFVGGWLLRAIGFYPFGFVGTLLSAFIGSIVVLWVVGLFTGNGNRRVRF
ncbi:MAG: Transglycosylase-associated protein [Chloroflexi bacterium]|jgi:uncharacterized membrane protein YeaQ/YmgE (transglycosylase-associated protein family)|nr:Transglycosylase-associated protein [Chloroflexota bacterium]